MRLVLTILFVIGGAVVVVPVFQGCGQYSSNTDASDRARTNPGAPVNSNPAPATSFSSDFTAPLSKQGVGEGRPVMSDADYDQRYARLRAWGTGYRQVNLYWSNIDDSGVNSTPAPQTCAADHTLVPANETERAALGFHRYRCLNTANLALWDKLFTRDQANGMQSGVVMWSAPANYRDPNCEGFTFAGTHLMDGCVPRDDAMDDFEDYANVLASRWNGGARGKISHFIVWNENGSSEWFDYTPTTSKSSIAADQVIKRIDKLAGMMKRVHAALQRHQRAALMYVSTDQLWAPGLQTGHMGTNALLEGLWARLGVEYSWSVAVHPYGNVDAASPANLYTFNNLERVSNLQADHLTAAGLSRDVKYPQYLMVASEQGWPITTAAGTTGALGRETQARQMCLAHAKVQTMPNVVAVAHNYFHSYESNENTGGSSGQGAFFGLIPYDIPNSLAGAEFTPAGRAFMSTMNAAGWLQRNDHYCCQVYGVGCVGGTNAITGVPSVASTHAITGVIDGVDTSVSPAVAKGWACARSMDVAVTVNLYRNGAAGTGQLLVSCVADQPAEAAIVSACVSNSSARRFSIPISNSLRASYAGQTLYAHGVSPIGLTNAQLGGSGSLTIPAN